MRSTDDDIPVLVVGSGPAGLAAAIELARRDVPVLLVERRTTLSAHPRATVLSLRSMELMRAWGLEEAVRGRSVEVDASMLLAETLAEAARGSTLAVGYPNREQSRVLSPVEPACVAQDDVEPILLAHLRAHPSAQIELGWEVTGVAVGGDGASVALRDVRTGTGRQVQARWVVAGDGARSTVRDALGIAMHGEEDVLTGWTTLLRAPLWDVLGPHRHLIYCTTRPEATFLPAGPEDRWLFAAAGEGPEAPTDRRVAELLRRAAGVRDLPVHIERSRTFSSAAQLVETFRAGPVLLAGDAAHRVTPRGGTGLNLALHDGFDLGWKLAWVERGWAPSSLLDSYEAERRPVAEHTVARSADPQGSLRAVEDEVHADLGGRIPHVWSDGRSTLDLLGLGLTLFASRGDRSSQAAVAGSRVPVDVRLLGDVAARAVGAAAGAPLLVRPDGRPAPLVEAVAA